MKARWWTVVLSGASLVAQIPGQYPGQYPPGGGYPGQYPPGPTDPNRIPGNRRAGRMPKKQAAVVSTTEGMFRRQAREALVIEGDDHRVIWYRVTPKTTIQKGQKTSDLNRFEPGDRVSVNSSADEEGHFTALGITWLRAGSGKDKAAAARFVDLPKLEGIDPGPEERAAEKPAEKDPKPPDGEEQQAQREPATTREPPPAPADPDDPGPPVLRRGRPVPGHRASQTTPKRASTDSEVAAIAESPEAERAPTAPPPDDLLARARHATASFSGSLPNFFCQQVTTRYETEQPKLGWNAIDVVTADLAYEDGLESYRNIRINNKPSNKRMDEIGGSTSTGEFASVLIDIFSPSTAAVFRSTGSDTIGGRTAGVFHFEVSREHSHWRIVAPSQLYYPAYQGSIWVDRETARVLRIEREALNLPKLFPFDAAESTTDYGFVRLNATDPVLLPTVAEALTCIRGSRLCVRNRMEFRNYRRFGSESNITFDKIDK